MVHRSPQQQWWPTILMIILALVGSSAVLGGVVLIVTGARDQSPAHSPPTPTGPTIVVIPDGP